MSDAAAEPAAVEAGISIVYASLASMAAMALIAVHIGAQRSLTATRTESVSSKDASYFPLYGSAALLGLYIVFKLVAKNIVDLLITTYFAFASVFAVASAFRPALRHMHRLAPGLTGVALAIVYTVTKHWALNNLVALSLAVCAIELITLSSFKASFILLAGLFVYDIFWVFGTDVMVTVAMKFTGPIKLMVPSKMWTSKPHYVALGLGDIVVPGIFLALLLRYDRVRSRRRGFTPARKLFYFGGMVAYAAAFVCCFAAMRIFEASQPALLYIVPACLGVACALALREGELGELYAYDESPEGSAGAPAAAAAVGGEVKAEPEPSFKEGLVKLWREGILGYEADEAAGLKKD